MVLFKTGIFKISGIDRVVGREQSFFYKRGVKCIVKQRFSVGVLQLSGTKKVLRKCLLIVSRYIVFLVKFGIIPPEIRGCKGIDEVFNRKVFAKLMNGKTS